MESKSFFQLVGTKVVEFKYKTYLDSGETKPPVIKVSYDVSFSDDDQFRSLLLLTISSKILTTSNKKFLDFTFKFEGEFKADPNEVNIELFKTLTEQNGLVSMLHLSRSILYGITALCGLTPGFTLPMFNVNKLNAEHNKGLKAN